MKIETEFTGLPLRKLESLLNNGWKVNGVHIQSVQMDGTLKHGAVTTGGMVLWWQPEQERVIAPSVRSVMQQVLDSLERYQVKRQDFDRFSEEIIALSEALAAPQNQLDDIDVADMAEPQPAQQEQSPTCWKHGDEPKSGCAWCDKQPAPKPGFYKDLAGTIPAVAGDAVALVVTQSFDDVSAAPQPAPDALHLAAMDLARTQAQRIAELEQQLAKDHPCP